ncbi:hypothetical protein LX87_04122 [Larkinella arboricola]|uniref:Uncharacterized protein n=1 Tax=Larkinella arboricola TaxID=643671 RepID=A0A327WSJ1_LARAB|nr:hypothetical protein [Larkinella arboricola]RAJ94237.1 hypothetical protein LX87_04122 [Larkinella arboricola]
MAKSDKIQPVNPSIEGTVNEAILTVEYWRERLSEKSSQFTSVRDIADRIGKLDSDFDGVRGYFKVQNAHAGRASLKVTAKIVRLMDQALAPDPAA